MSRVDEAQERYTPEWVERDYAMHQRLAAVRAIASRPRPEDIPVLRAALSDEYDATARHAARALKKLGPRALGAVDDLIAAATMPWEFGCPQRFSDAMEALVRIAPDHLRLTAICQHALTCQNYSIQKAAVVSLAKIGTPEARDILRDVDRFRDTSIQCKHWDNLVAKVLTSLGASSKPK